MTLQNIATLNDIERAYQLIQSYVHKTPVLKSELINKLLGCSVQFKCENFQKVGAFKYRGATHAILRLSDAEKSNGVTTHSSGNHAGALAKAASLQGIDAYIVMPKNAPKVKVEAVKSYGGIITFCEPTLEARETTLKKVQEETGATFIHPYDNFNVICGQGTACLELYDQVAEPDYVFAPVGGGGLLSGTSIVAKSIWQNTKVIAGEPKNADDAYQSFNTHELVPAVHPNSIADGLLTSLSDLTFGIIQKYVDEIITVSEEEIIEAMKLVYQYLKIVIEPSSAVPFAAVIKNKARFQNKSIVIIVSGGNVDLAQLPF
ncbi:MAG: pyridoxal-phosphate dependent enzyme [Salinivirgaceae bacterium]|nr:pyridoxal-phosphate dependent enzyme [Salinivirgaceae bacterium]